MQQDHPEYLEVHHSDRPATHTAIWLHGLGADARDFVPLVNHLRLPGDVAMKFIFPNARLRPITINRGMTMRGWYDIISIDPKLAKEDVVGLRESQSIITDLINREIAQGIPAQRMFLAGFSQGCAITLLTGLRYHERLAGLICLSGYLPLRENTHQEASKANADVPILMVHGEQDPVVPLERAQASRDYLQKLGYAVQWQTYPMQHEVCEPEVELISRFMSTHASPQAS